MYLLYFKYKIDSTLCKTKFLGGTVFHLTFVKAEFPMWFLVIETAHILEDSISFTNELNNFSIIISKKTHVQ